MKIGQDEILENLNIKLLAINICYGLTFDCQITNIYYEVMKKINHSKNSKLTIAWKKTHLI